MSVMLELNCICNSLSTSVKFVAWFDDNKCFIYLFKTIVAISFRKNEELIHAKEGDRLELILEINLAFEDITFLSVKQMKLLSNDTLCSVKTSMIYNENTLVLSSAVWIRMGNVLIFLRYNSVVLTWELLHVHYRTVKIKQIKFLPNICRKLMCISLRNLRIKMKSSHQMSQAFKCSWGGNLTQPFEKSRLILHLLMASIIGTCVFFWWHGSLLISMETLFAFLSWGSIPSATQTAILTL